MVGRISNALRSHQSVLAQSPTGSGKTVIASHMTRKIIAAGKRVYFTVHRSELLEQTAGTFNNDGIDHGYIAAGHQMNLMHRAQICSIDTLKRRIEIIPVPDYAIPDEAHHGGAAGWAKVFDYWKERGTKIIGLSATPHRLDGRGLDDHFDVLVPGPSVAWLIANGYLSGYRIFAPSTPDLSGVHTQMGDYKQSEVEAEMERPGITGDIVAHWLKYAERKKTILFAVSVAHSKHTCQQFISAGVRAAHLDGKTPQAERKQIAQDFARGKVELICNVDLFGEGYDLSAQAGFDVTIDCVILARPTQSLTLFLQQIGRALRVKADGSKALILDHAGNTMQHGLPDEDRIWTLEGTRGNGGKKNRDEPNASVAQCPNCFGVHAPAALCPYCGHVYKIKERKIDERPGELEEINAESLRRRRMAAQGVADDMPAMLAMGYSKRRAAKILAARVEKAALRARVAELTLEAGEKLSDRDLKKMKPKALKEKIVELETVLKKNGHDQFMSVANE